METGTIFLAMWLVFSQSEAQVLVKLLGKTELRNEGNVERIIVVNERKVLLVNDGLIQVWSFKNKAKPTIISSVESRGFWHGASAYCRATSAFAHADSTRNTAIFFYAIKAEGQIEKTKVIDFSSQFKYGPTMAFEFSPNGSLFAYASQNEKPITVLETKNYSQVLSLPYRPYVDMLCFLDDKLLLAVSMQGQATIWDVTKTKPHVVKEFQIPLRPSLCGCVQDVRHNRKEGMITLVYLTPAVELGPFTVRRGKLGLCEITYGDKTSIHHRTVELGDFGGFCTCKLSPDRKRLMTGDKDANLRALDIGASKARAVFHRKLEDVRVIRSIQYLDNNTFAVGCLGHYLYVFSITDRETTCNPRK